MPDFNDWSSVTYGNGKFVAVTYNSDASAYSTDGTTWTQANLPTSAGWRSVTHGDDKFVAVAAYSSVSAYSTDGITWTQAAIDIEDWRSVNYGDGKFVAVAAYSSASVYSTDGITWTQATVPGFSGIWRLAVGSLSNVEMVPKTIYTVPENKEAIVSGIFISNTAETSDTYNFAVVPAGETLSDVHQIRKNTVIDGNDFNQIETKITLSDGDSLVALSTAVDKLNITIFGVEK
jgi:hypothetical protein